MCGMEGNGRQQREEGRWETGGDAAIAPGSVHVDVSNNIYNQPIVYEKR